MSKIAVLGATGNYGGRAIEHLLNKGVQPSDIVAIYRNEEKASSLKGKGLELSYGDYQSDNFGPSVFKDAEKLLFISGLGQDNFKRIQDHIVVIDAARRAGIKHIVYTGLAFPEKSTFGMENVHLATEYVIKSTGITYTVLRNTFYTDFLFIPRDMKRAVNDGKLYSLSKGVKVNFIPRDDMAKAAAAVLTSEGHDNKIYEITSPKTYSFKDIADILTKVSGKKVEYVETTIEEYTKHLDGLGIPKESQMWDPVMFQLGFVNGWAEVASSALSDLIGVENIKTPEQLIREMF